MRASLLGRAALFVSGAALAVIVACSGNCPEDTCPGWYDLGSVCSARGLCYTQDGPATCESDHLRETAPHSCDIVTPGPSSRITIDVSSLWKELGTRNDFGTGPGQVSEKDYSETAAPWNVTFDGADAGCDCPRGGGCGCPNVPSTVHTIVVETSSASEYVSLIFDDRDCVPPVCKGDPGR